MKRIQSFILACILLFGVFTIQPATLSLAAAGKYGDGNNDGLINAADALIALRVAVNKQTVSDEIAEYLDVDDNTVINAADALMILQFSVGKRDSFPADKGTVDPDDKTDWLSMSMEEIVEKIDGETEASAITDSYALHEDGGLIYNPLSREMTQEEKTKYNVSKKTTGRLTLPDGSVMNYSVPTDVTAYDMIPIEYSLTNPAGASEPLYVEATTFEEGNGSYYDLCLPGNITLKFDYLGYVSAKNNTANRPFLSRNFETDVQGKQYPQYDASELVASDTAPVTDYLWFKFNITNTGNTILENDGNGSFCFQPLLLDTNGNTVKNVANLYYRLTEPLYPGESTELYVYFGESHGMSLAAGNYTIAINCLVRNEQSAPDWGTKIWGGYNYGTCKKDITVTENPSVTNRSAATYTTNRSAIRDTWLHTYEEFTTSYDAWLAPALVKSNEKHILYVQPAAWSDHIALKLMRGNADIMKSVNIPLTVETDSIQIKLNTKAILLWPANPCATCGSTLH